jgi:hypothetical protein
MQIVQCFTSEVGLGFNGKFLELICLSGHWVQFETLTCSEWGQISLHDTQDKVSLRHIVIFIIL